MAEKKIIAVVGATARSYNNHLRSLKTFFRFCQSRGCLSREAALLEGVGKRKEASADVEVFTPAELRALLHAATPRVKVCIALQALGGVRSEELLRLTWLDPERRKGFVELSASKSKTSSRRLVPILRISRGTPHWREGLAAFEAFF